MPRGQQTRGTARAAVATSTWGRRLVIRPGVPIASGGDGVGPDIGNRKRLIDVRAPGFKPGQSSNPYVVYLTARAIFHPDVVGPSGITARVLRAVLETGSGGVTRSEEFQVPAHGKAIHIGADSVRLHVVYQLATTPVPDEIATLIGFDCNANVSISGLYPGRARQDSTLFADNAPLLPTPQTFRIPQFSEELQFVASAPANYQIEWLDEFGNPLLESPLTSGADFADFGPIPINSVFIRITPTIPVGIMGAVGLNWNRPS